MEQKSKFGLLTTVTMISGIVIGSGIFFKTDDILYATNGNVLGGVFLWTFGAFGIIFGGLVVSEYAKNNSNAGGLITYVEDAWGSTLGFLAGWFQVVFYYPAIIAILSWIAAIYTGQLLNITNPKDPRLWIIACVIFLTSFIFNILNTKKAGIFQNITLFIKITVIIGLASLGLFFGNIPQTITHQPHMHFDTGLFAGLIACAFSYDGWFVAPSIAHEIKNPKKNLSRALVLTPLLILAVYLAYFIGISSYLGPEIIMSLGDASVSYLATQLFGNIGNTFITIAVVISILGAINGLVLGYIRLPYALAIRDFFPKSDVFKQVHPKWDIPHYSAGLALGLVFIWFGLHALSIFIPQFSSFQIDSLPIVLTYIFYSSLYLRTLLFGKDLSFSKRYVYPILALFGASLVIYGGIIQPNFSIYILISLFGIGIGYLFKTQHKVQ